VLAGSRLDDPVLLDQMRAALAAVTRHGARVACIGQDVLGVSTVVVENRLGAAALADAMVELGHRSFAVLTGPHDHLTARDRTEGFCYGLAGAAPLPEHLLSGEFTWEGGYDTTKAFLASAGGTAPVDCLFAVNDVMALGAVAALREAGLRVPDDIAVAGFDDVPSLRDVVPGITTVRLPMTQMGATVVELALDDSPAARTARVRVPGEIVLRESTRRVVTS
jgi:LacI family transcriptional regulator